MAIYRFRVTFEDQDDVTRDIEIRSTQTFEDLHHGIHSAIGFDASKQASFYLSDDHWTKGQEFTNRELKENEKEYFDVINTLGHTMIPVVKIDDKFMSPDREFSSIPDAVRLIFAEHQKNKKKKIF